MFNHAILVAFVHTCMHVFILTCVRVCACVQAREHAGGNLELLIKVKQGQDEMETETVVTDYSDSLLVPRAIVENANAGIFKGGGERVAALNKIKEFRKLINFQQWEQEYLALQVCELCVCTECVCDIVGMCLCTLFKFWRVSSSTFVCVCVCVRVLVYEGVVVGVRVYKPCVCVCVCVCVCAGCIC